MWHKSVKENPELVRVTPTEPFNRGADLVCLFAYEFDLRFLSAAAQRRVMQNENPFSLCHALYAGIHHAVVVLDNDALATGTIAARSRPHYSQCQNLDGG
jgi:hypothetical protein